MKGRDGIGDRRLFNADRMLMTTYHPVVASWRILLTTDGRVLLTVVHQSWAEHRIIPIQGEGRSQRNRMRWLNMTTAIATKVGR